MSHLKDSENSCIQEKKQLWGAELLGRLSCVGTSFRQLRVILSYGSDLMFSWLSHVPLIFSTAAPVVKRQTLLMTTNPMMDCSFYGVRKVSESQNKQGVKIKNWGLQQQPQLAGRKAAAPSALSRIAINFLYTTQSQRKIPCDLQYFTFGALSAVSCPLFRPSFWKLLLAETKKTPHQPPVSYWPLMRSANSTRKGPEHWMEQLGFGNNTIL